jgi:hypothetical protein
MGLRHSLHGERRKLIGFEMEMVDSWRVLGLLLSHNANRNEFNESRKYSTYSLTFDSFVKYSYLKVKR